MTQVSTGKGALASLLGFNVKNHGFWKSLVKAALVAVEQAYRTRSEIVFGGQIADGASTSTSTLRMDFSSTAGALGWMLGRGVLMPVSSGDTDLNMLAAGSKVLRATWADGTDAHVITLGSGKTAQFALVLANSNGSGGVTDTPKLVIVFAGTAANYHTKTAPPSSAEIAHALASASGVHDGTTSWVWVAYGTWDDSPAVDATLNVNNVEGR